MFFFEPPPPTRYDLRFTLAGIPIRVHPLFWLMTILFGSLGGDLLHLVIWIPVVFVSILVHELGHALMMRRFGQPASIVLHLTGGLTLPEPTRWGGRWASVALESGQEVLVSLAGAGAGFLLGAVLLAAVAAAGGTVGLVALFGVLPLPMAFFPGGGRLVNLLLSALLWVNVVWGFVNLVPVYPLDGGNIARRLFVRFDPLDGLRKSLWLSVAAGAVAALTGLVLLGSMYLGFLYAILAIQSYQALRGPTAGRYY